MILTPIDDDQGIDVDEPGCSRNDGEQRGQSDALTGCSSKIPDPARSRKIFPLLEPLSHGGI
jgi:hypothetical protein